MNSFEYAAPRTEGEAVQLLAEKPGRTEILAGGTDLVSLMKKMIITPERVVNIMQVDSLKSVQVLNDGSLSIGSAVTLDVMLLNTCLDVYPAVRQAILGINSMQLQCQGTLGGEILQRPQCWYFRQGRGFLCGDVERGANRYHAILGNSGAAKFVSSSRLAPALISLDARARVIGPGRDEERLLPVAELFRVPEREDQRENVLRSGQLLTHIILSPIAGRTCATYEIRHGSGPEFPLAAAAATLSLDVQGIVRSAKVVLGQVAPVPWISQEVEKLMSGRLVDERLAERAGEAAVAAATPLSENAYKVQLAKVAVKRAILLAAGRGCGDFQSPATPVAELV